MRRFDKKLNIQNANLLAEQRYLQSKGLINEDTSIDEISGDLKRRAFMKASDDIYKLGDEGKSIEQAKRELQAKKFQTSINPLILNKLTEMGKTYNLDVYPDKNIAGINDEPIFIIYFATKPFDGAFTKKNYTFRYSIELDSDTLYDKENKKINSRTLQGMLKMDDETFDGFIRKMGNLVNLIRKEELEIK